MRETQTGFLHNRFFWVKEMQQTQSTKTGIQGCTSGPLYAASICCCDPRLFSLVYTGVRATSLQPSSTPGHSCSICCSQMRGSYPHFTELFTICVGRIAISCGISCTLLVHFPKGCFFQFSFQLNGFTLYFCLSTSTSQVACAALSF